MMEYLDKLPTETLCHIMRFIDLRVYLAMRLACRRLSHVVDYHCADLHRQFKKNVPLFSFPYYRRGTASESLPTNHSPFVTHFIAEAINNICKRVGAVIAPSDVSVQFIRLPNTAPMSYVTIGQHICADFGVRGFIHGIVIPSGGVPQKIISLETTTPTQVTGYRKCNLTQWLDGCSAVYRVDCNYGRDLTKTYIKASCFAQKPFMGAPAKSKMWTSETFALFCQTKLYIAPDLSRHP